MKIIGTTPRGSIEISFKVIPKSDEKIVVNLLFDMLRQQQFDVENIKIERELEPLVCPPKEE